MNNDLNQNICQYCGSEFISSTRKLTCSKSCSAKYVSKQNILQKNFVSCEICSKEFEVSRSSKRKTCNDCKKGQINNSYRDISLKKCEICGKEFSYDWRRDLNTRRYTELRFCSPSCSKTFSSRTNDINRLKQSICIDCGKPIFIKNNASSKTSRCEECYILKYGVRKKREKKIKEGPKEKVLFLNCKYCGRKISIPNIKKHENACEQNPNAVHTKHNKKRKDCREGYIYLTTNLLNGKGYVGKHVGKPENSKTYLGSGIYLLKAIKKNMEKKILKK